MSQDPPASSLDALFRPKSIALIGASSDPNRIGGRPIDFTKRGGFSRPIYPINPNQQVIQGLVAYPTIEAVPGPVDLGVIALPAHAAMDSIESCIAKGTRAIILFSAGFAEVDEAGKVAQESIRKRCEEAGVRLLGPNCLGVMNIADGLFCTFSTVLDNVWPRLGRVSVVSQSGAFGAYAYGLAAERGIGFSKWIATGNEADVDVAQCIDWLASDAETDIIMAYIEGCRSGDSLRRSLAKASNNGKPVIVLKAGATDVGAIAVASHTGSLTGKDSVWDTVIREAGAYRAQTVDEFVDIAYACSNSVYPRGNRLGVVTISGGMGVLMADAGSRLGLELPSLPAEAQAQIKSIIPFASAVNPVDVTAQLLNVFHEFGHFLDIMLGSGGFHSLVVFMQQLGKTPKHYALLREPLLEARQRYPDTLFVLCGGYSDQARSELEANGFILFEDPARAVNAVSVLARFQSALSKEGRLPVFSEASARASAITLPRGVLDEATAKRVLADYGIPFAPERIARTRSEAMDAATQIGYPVVLKVLSADIPHKSDVGGVELDLSNQEAVGLAWDRVMEKLSVTLPMAKIEGVLVASMIRGGVETVLGLSRDPVFGPVVMFGLGGVFVEIFRDVTFRTAPVDHAEALVMIQEIKGFPLLVGARGRAPVNLDTLADAVVALSQFGAANRTNVQSVDINPFIALPDGGVAVDALIVTDCEES